MEDELFGALAELGIEMGCRLIQNWVRDDEKPNYYACIYSMVQCSAKSAARVSELLGVTATVSQGDFAEVAGIFIGYVTATIEGLTGQKLDSESLDGERVEGIVLSVYDDMQQRSHRPRL